jgi:hypothetical protein
MINGKRESALDERYARSVLIFLYAKNSSAICGDFTNIITSPQTRNKLMKRLEASGLVTIDLTLKPRKTFHVKLTDKGKEIAKTLRVAEQIEFGELETGAEPIDYGTFVVKGD